MHGRLLVLAVAACALVPPLAAQATSSRVIECAASSRQRVQCDAGGQVDTVKLVKDLSYNRCSAAGSWGWTDKSVWADNSCRGQFEVVLRTVAAGGDTRRITCGTLTTQRVMCKTEGAATSVRLVRGIGPITRCRKGTTWDHTDSLIWAGNGCRAEFEVTYKDVATPLPAPAPAPTTRLITCGNASGTQVTCRTDGYATGVRLVRDLSARSCRKGSNWGNTDSFIWTNKGCRAQFEVTYGSPPTDPSTEPGIRRITCGTLSSPQVTCKTEGYATSVRLVRELSNNRCRKDFNWGHTDSFIWTNKGCRAEFEVSYRPASSHVRTVTCGVLTGAQVQCLTRGTALQVRLARELSTNRCRKGTNWGNTDSFIWANGGCKAEFEVTYRGVAPPRPTPGPSPTPAPEKTRAVSCGNVSGSSMSCNAFGTVATVRLLRDRSGGRCSQPSSWGLNEAAVWVTRGCYGDFEVTYATTMKTY